MFYAIRARGQLSADCSDWLGVLTIRNLENGQGLLYGRLPDQAALLRILNCLHVLNLTILALSTHEETLLNRRPDG